jgi:hypothetical protein
MRLMSSRPDEYWPRAPGPGDAWAADYPFAGDIAAIDSFLRATGQHGEQRPFGYYQIIRAADWLAVGGAGFKGPPDDEPLKLAKSLIENLPAAGRDAS